CIPDLNDLFTRTTLMEKDVWLKDLCKLEGLLPDNDAWTHGKSCSMSQIKRRTLKILGVIPRYITDYNYNAIRLIVDVARIINSDPDTNSKDYDTLYFLPDYSVSLAEVFIPAFDISQHISTAGAEASSRVG
ncbi:hypothetical protein H0H93_009315, partial [Arthromyces matolae]